MFSGGIAITNFAFLLAGSQCIQPVSIVSSSEKWRLEMRERAGSVSVVGIQDNILAASDSVVSSEPLMVVTYQVSSSCLPGLISVQGQIVSMGNAQGQRVVPVGATKTVDIFFVDRDASANKNGVGSVVVLAKRIVSAFAFPRHGVLFNTAILNGARVSSPITLVFVENFGDLIVYHPADFAGSVTAPFPLSCTSLSSAALKVDSDCSSVFLDGSETSASLDSGLSVVVMYDDWEAPLATFVVKVFAPVFPLTIDVTDRSLGAITHLLAYDEVSQACKQLYQRSALHVYGSFSFVGSSQKTQPIDVTRFTARLLQVSDSDVAEISLVERDGYAVGASLQGLALGSVSVSLSTPDWSDEVTVYVEDTPVRATRLDVSPIAHVDLDIPSSLGSSDIVALNGVYSSKLTEINGLVYVHARVLFDDATVMELTPEMGLGLYSLNTSLFDVSYGQFIYPVDDGAGQDLKAVWFSPNGEMCDSPVEMISTLVAIEVDLPELVGIAVQLSSEVVTYVEDLAHEYPFYVPVASVVSVYGLYDDGSSHVVPASEGWTVTVGQDYSGIVSYDSDTFEITASGGEANGLVLFEVSALGFTVSSNITVVSLTSEWTIVLQSYAGQSSDLFAELPQAVAITSLHPIGLSSVFGQGQLFFKASVSADNGTDVVLPSGLVEFSPVDGPSSSLVSIDANGIVSVVGAVTEETTVLLAAVLRDPLDESVVATAEFTLTLSPVPLEVASVSVLSVALTGSIGYTSTPVVSITVSDGSSHVALAPQVPLRFPGLLSFSTSDPLAASVDSDSGVITLLGNLNVLNTLVVSIAGSLPSISTNASFACNLVPMVGDVDLGSSGLVVPLPAIYGDATVFSVPVFVNLGSTIGLRDVRLSLSFNASFVEYLDAQVGPAFVGGSLKVSLVSSTGELQIDLVVNSPLASGIVQVASLRFRSHPSPSNDVLVSYSGVVRSLRTSLGQTIGPATPRLMISARVAHVISPLPSPDRKRRASPGDLCTVPYETPCSSCVAPRHTGDSNGDCVFDSQDIEFALEFVAESLLDPSFGIGILLADQFLALDANLDGVVSTQDVYFLQRVDVGLARFIKDVTVIQPVGAGCLLEVSALVLM